MTERLPPVEWAQTTWMHGQVDLLADVPLAMKGAVIDALISAGGPQTKAGKAILSQAAAAFEPNAPTKTQKREALS